MITYFYFRPIMLPIVTSFQDSTHRADAACAPLPIKWTIPKDLGRPGGSRLRGIDISMGGTGQTGKYNISFTPSFYYNQSYVFGHEQQTAYSSPDLYRGGTCNSLKRLQAQTWLLHTVSLKTPTLHRGPSCNGHLSHNDRKMFGFREAWTHSILPLAFCLKTGISMMITHMIQERNSDWAGIHRFSSISTT
ncbi:hypothetical protein BCR34DRAFT_51778 [Clohesyomyces aquaticus]|uniref:Uncharacterized protein n=1 Tax=Clohesyomyces aquaticus TaxID=1231657 RepID=A0A1Y2A4M1_9PLEO|nr:hypothetical protein BCR34DRAFT_51778 [Clohesyomyces aquaticus]